MKYRMTIHIEIQDEASSGYGSLNIRETVLVTAKDFLELAAILGRFHELAQKIQTLK